MNLNRLHRVIVLFLYLLGRSDAAEPLPNFDFTQPEVVAEWTALNDISLIEAATEGMRIRLSGSDPYIAGPARDYPEATPLWVLLKLKAPESGLAQIFYYTDQLGTAEERSVRFPVVGGDWREITVPVPALGKGTYLRFDPPGKEGTVTVASIELQKRILLEQPPWPQPFPPRIAVNARDEPWVVKSGDLEIVQGDTFIEDFFVLIENEPFAAGFTQFNIGYLNDYSEQRWMNSHQSSAPESFEAIEGGGFESVFYLNDLDEGIWRIRRRMVPSGSDGAINVETTITVDKDLNIIHLPMFAVLPGIGTFGESKKQGLFAGLEYLDDEPSSSTADIEFPGSQRQVPDNLKITFPLMAIAAEGRYLGLIWEMAPHFSAMFDSPDRLFRSGGHIMGVLFPGSDGTNRVEGNLLPYDGVILKANEPLTLKATLIGGRGESVVAAIQKYIELKGLPEPPDIGMDFEGYVRLMAKGWLDSGIREDGRFRHAIWPHDTGVGPAADAVAMMEWLASQTDNEELAARLTEAASESLSEVPTGSYALSHVSHIHYPVVPLLHNHIEENVNSLFGHTKTLIARFDDQNRVLYQRSDRFDFGTTHWEPDANGLTATSVERLLMEAAFIGDRDLLDDAIKKLCDLDRFDNSVCRGAQTWEVPLHTPDILAAAYLVGAYTMGYELTGDEAFLTRAKYWAWTGVPFIYLRAPVDGPIGLYATIPVLGATHWKAPNWMGLPVQWCGLVYSHALYHLSRQDPNGPWKQIADGITASGIQQTYPIDDPDYPGLLPDSVSLRPQIRNLAAINPGTLQANAPYFFDRPDIYDFAAFPESGVLVHAPGRITKKKEDDESLSFDIEGWSSEPFTIRILGAPEGSRVKIDGVQAAEGEEIIHVQLKGNATVELRLSM